VEIIIKPPIIINESTTLIEENEKERLFAVELDSLKDGN